MTFNDRVEKAKGLINDLGQDITQILSLLQMSSPMGAAIAKRANERYHELKQIFESNEEPNGKE